MFLRLVATGAGALNVNLAQYQTEFFQLKELERIYIICDSRLNAINIQLPTISDVRLKSNMCIVIDDAFGAAGTNNITISRGGSDKINFNETSFVMAIDYHKIQVEQTLNNQNSVAGNWMTLSTISVAMTVPSILAVTGSPVKGAGTLALSLSTQLANKIFAGPTSGIPAIPTFRSLVAADLAGAILSAAAELDFGNIPAQNSSDLNVPCVGAALGDPVALGVPNTAVNNNSCFTAWVNAPDNVRVRFNNYSAIAIDPGTGEFKVRVFK